MDLLISGNFHLMVGNEPVLDRIKQDLSFDFGPITIFRFDNSIDAVDRPFRWTAYHSDVIHLTAGDFSVGGYIVPQGVRLHLLNDHNVFGLDVDADGSFIKNTIDEKRYWLDRIRYKGFWSQNSINEFYARLHDTLWLAFLPTYTRVVPSDKEEQLREGPYVTKFDYSSYADNLDGLIWTKSRIRSN